MRKLLAFLLLALLVLLPNVVSAQNAIRISPVKSSFVSAPGATVRASITLQNPSNKLITVAIMARDFEASPELNGEPKLIENGSSPYGISNWFADANLNKKLTIPANQNIEYEAVFRVPSSATPKTYYGSVTFVPDNGTDATIGSLVFITVGNPPTTLSTADLSYSDSSDATKPYGVFTATINNSSEGLSTPVSKLKITDSDGKIVEELSQDGQGSILPNSARKYTFTPTKALPKTVLTATISSVDQNGTTADKSIQLNFAPISAESESEASAQESRFWLIPVLLLLFTIVGLSVLLYLKFRRKKITPVLAPTDTNENPGQFPPKE